MPKVKDNNIELEILIATMNRTSLDFLSVMFLNHNYLNFNILIVNQTSKTELLKSEHASIRVINSFKKGLSKSRNLAIDNSIKPICLLADDDVVFTKGFVEAILKAHKKHTYSIITFQTQTTKNQAYWKYPTTSRFHNNFISQKTLSIEITFKKEKINNLRFQEQFGLGAKFEDGENFIFLTQAKKKGLKLWFSNKTISIHEPTSSSDEVESDRLLYAKSAIHYYIYGNLAYFWVFKFIFFLFRKKIITSNQVAQKLKVGFNGIKDYKIIAK